MALAALAATHLPAASALYASFLPSCLAPACPVLFGALVHCTAPKGPWKNGAQPPGHPEPTNQNHLGFGVSKPWPGVFLLLPFRRPEPPVHCLPAPRAAHQISLALAAVQEPHAWGPASNISRASITANRNDQAGPRWFLAQRGQTGQPFWDRAAGPGFRLPKDPGAASAGFHLWI